MPSVAKPALFARLAETWFHRPDSPTRLVMEITRRCNLRCAMCKTWQLSPRHELTPDEIAHTLRQLPKLTWLDVTGGEPFMRADAFEVFDAILSSTPSLALLHFPTNGWFTERVVSVARRVREARPDVELIITVSIDGPREVHDRIRGRTGSYDRALTTLRALRQIPGVAAYVGTTITAFNEDHVEELGASLAREVPGFHATDWHWNQLQISQHFFGNAEIAGTAAPRRSNLVVEHVKRRGAPRNLVDVMELSFLTNLEFYKRGEPTGVVCQSLRSSAFISPEGDVYPCHVYDRPLGNVRDVAFHTLWHSDEVLEAREDIKRLACNGCFTPCEAYPALAGSPIAAVANTTRRALRVLYEEGVRRIVDDPVTTRSKPQPECYSEARAESTRR